MDSHTAHLILYAITAIALVAWITGLQFLIASAREPRVDDEFSSHDTAKSLPIQGTAEVEGEPETLASRATSALAKGNAGVLGPVRIVVRTADSVVFNGDPASTGLGSIIRQGAIHFTRLGQGKTRADYAVDVPRGKALLLGGAILQMLGLTAIATGFWLLSTYVADAPNPAIRAQVVQMVQVVHFLWPPFLCGALYRKRLGALRAALETFIRNLPYCEP